MTMNEPIYLLTGVTGATGGAAARELRKQGRRVRGLVHKDDARAEALRTLGVETIVGDLLDLDSLRRAMEGVAGAYFVYPFSDSLIDAAAFTAQAAIEAGVQSLVNMSQKSARREAKSHAARDHWVSERVFDWSGVPTTHIRPTFFAEWLLYPLPGWQVKNGVIRFPLGRGRHAPIAAEDQWPPHRSGADESRVPRRQSVPTLRTRRARPLRDRGEAKRYARPALPL
jgi:NAD(P)H dehydrogenase (quinone)